MAEPSVVEGPDELSRFSDKPGDASLEDLFPPIDKQGDYGAGKLIRLAMQFREEDIDGSVLH